MLWIGLGELTPRHIARQCQGTMHQSMSGCQTTPYRARNEWQQGSYHPNDRTSLESKQGTEMPVNHLFPNIEEQVTYTYVVYTSSSAIPHGQKTANEMSNND